MNNRKLSQEEQASLSAHLDEYNSAPAEVKPRMVAMVNANLEYQISHLMAQHIRSRGALFGGATPEGTLFFARVGRAFLLHVAATSPA